MADVQYGDTLFKGSATGKDPEQGADLSGKLSKLSVRLVPVNNSDQPVICNYSNVNVAPGMAFIDFGFFEPAMLAALNHVLQEGSALPDTLNGKLATRVVVGFDVLANLYQQLSQVMHELNKAEAK